MQERRKPLPVPDYDTQPFWDACKEHRFIAQRCRSCDTWRWPPRSTCANCHSTEFDWQKLSGRGVVRSFVVMHRAFHPAFAGEVPYVVVNVVLDGSDGKVVFSSNLEGMPWEEVSVGLSVEMFFEDVVPEASLPKFRPS